MSRVISRCGSKIRLDGSELDLVIILAEIPPRARKSHCSEFVVGIPVEDEKGEILGSSKNVPYSAIPQVTVSRIGMAIPSMVVGPVIFQRVMKMRFYR
ncbi:unnamed protein product, partial [Nippostrongylus brasiliensis]|uniref:AT24389p (inferred by orthology to a D. melanogaster protein) n=1 Tax=Nippostrongylus brasiliensis TaxID=27835 RepID=A0A0N4YY73_NIPBR